MKIIRYPGRDIAQTDQGVGAHRDGGFPGDKRMVLDFSRSGAVEAVAGGVAPAQLSGKLANSNGQSKKFEATYALVRVAAVRQADDARKAGRKRMREEQK